MIVKNETLYVSGGMTNIPCFNFPMFDDVEHALVLAGAKHVWSPAENDRRVLREHGINDVTKVPGYAEGDVSRYNESIGETKDLFQWDFNTIVNECTGIVLIPRWELSTGARWERIVAEALNLHIILAHFDDEAVPGNEWWFEADPNPQLLTQLLKAATNDWSAGHSLNKLGLQPAMPQLQPTPTPVVNGDERLGTARGVWSGASGVFPGYDGRDPRWPELGRLEESVARTEDTLAAGFAAELDDAERIAGLSLEAQFTTDYEPKVWHGEAASVHGLIGETVGHEFDDERAHGTFGPGAWLLGEQRVTDTTTGGQKGSKIEAYALIPAEPLRWLAEMFGRGALKYDARNWEKGYDWSLSFSAMQRHAWAHWNGELLIPQTPDGEPDDPTAGVPHLTAVAWHAFAMLEWVLRVFEGDHSPQDDRPLPFER
jgi:Domain of unknown function (DUF5664)/Domain of unknown function (DUF4406)